MNNRSYHHRSWVIVSIAVVLVVGALLIRSGLVRGDDPDTDDRTYLAQGPVLDAQTLAANRAHADELERQEELRRQDALRHPEAMATKDPINTPLHVLAQPTVAVPLGILETFNPLPGAGSRYRMQNMWQGYIGTDFAHVYAGVKSDDPNRFVLTGIGQGVLYVQLFPADPNAAGFAREFLTPTRSGPLRLITADGPRLTVAATHGSARGLFDVGRRAFASWSP